MKILIVYYSRTGITKKIAHALTEKLKCDVIPLIDHKNRNGPLGYLSCAAESATSERPMIEEVNGLKEYDLVVIGTPIWAGTVCGPVRTFLHKYKKELSKVAFFCTMGVGGDKDVFWEMERIAGKAPVATISFTTADVKKGRFSLNPFAKQIQPTKK